MRGRVVDDRRQMFTQSVQILRCRLIAILATIGAFILNVTDGNDALNESGGGMGACPRVRPSPWAGAAAVVRKPGFVGTGAQHSCGPSRCWAPGTRQGGHCATPPPSERRT